MIEKWLYYWLFGIWTIWNNINNNRYTDMITQTQIENQIWLQTEENVRFTQFKTTGGANENFTNIILKENEIKKKIIIFDYFII